MALNLTNPALQYDQPSVTDPATGLPLPASSIIKFFKNPALRAQAFASEAAKTAQPETSDVAGQLPESQISLPPMANAGEVVPGQSDFSVSQVQPPAANLPKFIQPKFSDVSQGPGGLPTPVNAGETKLGKLLHIIRAVTEGGLVGSQAGTFGGGFEAAEVHPYQELQLQQGAERGGLENQMLRAQVGMLPWQRMLQVAQLQKTRADIEKEKYLTPRSGGVYDVSKGAYAPGAGPTEGNQDKQTFDYLTTEVFPGLGRPLTPAEAYAHMAQMKQDVKPDPAQKAKDVFQASMAKVAGEGLLTPDAYSSLPKLTAAIRASKTLTDPEKQSALSWRR